MKVGMFFITVAALAMLKLTLEMMGWFSIAASTVVWVVGLVLAVGWCWERLRYWRGNDTLKNTVLTGNYGENGTNAHEHGTRDTVLTVSGDMK